MWKFCMFLQFWKFRNFIIWNFEILLFRAISNLENFVMLKMLESWYLWYFKNIHTRSWPVQAMASSAKCQPSPCPDQTMVSVSNCRPSRCRHRTVYRPEIGQPMSRKGNGAHPFPDKPMSNRAHRQPSPWPSQSTPKPPHPSHLPTQSIGRTAHGQIKQWHGQVQICPWPAQRPVQPIATLGHGQSALWSVLTKARPAHC
jgi:hypothetical protein